MIVTIDTDKMFKLGITPDEYTFLQLIQNKALTSARKLVDKVPTLTYSTLEKLTQKRLIHHSQEPGAVVPIDVSKVIVRSTFTGEVNKDDLFEEFLLEFPGKIIRPDGSHDYLKTDLNKSRKLYGTLVKKDEALHKQIMECLRLEVATRTRTGKLGYMKRLYKWLTTDEWRVWQSVLQESNVGTDELGYGLKLE